MTIESDPLTDSVVVPERSARVASGIGVYPGFQTELVDVVNHRLQSLGKAFGVGDQLSCGVAASEIAVVDVDETVAEGVEPKFRQRIGLTADQTVADIDAVGVPGTPSHHRRLCGHGSEGDDQI